VGIVELEFIAEPWRDVVYVVLAFALAWIVSRLSKRMAERFVRRYEAKHVDPEGSSTGVIISLKRHETEAAARSREHRCSSC
jgi:hypothetical protein